MGTPAPNSVETPPMFVHNLPPHKFGWSPAPDPRLFPRVDVRPQRRTDADIARLREHLKNCKGRTDEDALRDKFGDASKPLCKGEIGKDCFWKIEHAAAACGLSQRVETMPDGSFALFEIDFEPAGTLPNVGDVIKLTKKSTSFSSNYEGTVRRTTSSKDLRFTAWTDWGSIGPACFGFYPRGNEYRVVKRKAVQSP